MSHESQQRILLFIFIFFAGIFQGNIIAQNNYSEAWKALNTTDYKEAISYFEKAKNDKGFEEKAALVLTLLYERMDQAQKASEAFAGFYDSSVDPYPELYALWFTDGVTGEVAKRDDHQLDLMAKIKADDRYRGKLDATLQYYFGLHYMISNKSTKAFKYFDKINNIRDWQFAGPFDNVMNSGFDKDFGVLSHPEAGAGFQSKYGAEVTWFDPPVHSRDGYTFKNMYFYGNNAIIYAQTFLESENEQEVLLKFGYSGSLKIWINDGLVYSEPDRRRTEMDYFQYRCTLNKGYNRILVQLGDYQESDANFTVRFTDLDHKPLSFSNSNILQPYQKYKGAFTRIPFYALEALKAKAASDPADILYKVLLTKAYMRSNELDMAETVLKEGLALEPDNYLMLRTAVLFYSQAGNETEQTRIYEIFSSKYSNSRDPLYNEIEEYLDENNKEKVKELVAEYLALYDAPQKVIYCKIALATVNEEVDLLIDLVNEYYEKWPDDYNAMISKYQIEKSIHSAPENSNAILKTYLKNNYSYPVIEELAKNYLGEGKHDKAIDLLERSVEVADYQTHIYRNMVNIHYRQKKYDKAIEICKKIRANVPSDHRNLSDLAALYKLTEDTASAISYYKEALAYFPFSFEFNEKIRELKGLKIPGDLIPFREVEEVIKDYEANFNSGKKEDYDIVYDAKAKIVFKSKAEGIVRKYILKINDESAIQEWQRLDFSPSNNLDMMLHEALIIKKNGNKIDGERHGSEVVFTNLEIGDYIYAYYTQKQVDGGKSALFISDSFNFNSYSPTFEKAFFLLAEEGLEPNFQGVNFEAQPEKKQLQEFSMYSWIKKSPEILKSEPYTLPFSDIAKSIHISLGNSWYDIAQWYSDLTSHQANADYTIQEIVKELFEGKNYSDEEKAKVIYDFVCKNIQYSSIDFRQGSYIPQKASKIYHSRLGDCKDISTLYAAIGRETGLDVDLVLINTRNNGQKDVLLPSLNFNHCIVKVNLENNPMFLELTDSDLPFGHLYYYHQGAAILEIPYGKVPEDIDLGYLDINQSFQNDIVRKATVQIDKNLKIHTGQEVTKSGTMAAGVYDAYYEKDPEQQKETLQQSISSFYNSSVHLDSVKFIDMQPRKEKTTYQYSYTVEGDVLKVGTFRSFKIPFSDVLATTNILKEEERIHDFDFLYYETADHYDEDIELSLEDGLTWVEIPENVALEYNGNSYKLEFEQENPQTLSVRRTYKVNKANIKASEFPEFKAFISKVLEAEKTNVVFK